MCYHRSNPETKGALLNKFCVTKLKLICTYYSEFIHEIKLEVYITYSSLKWRVISIAYQTLDDDRE